MSEISFLYRGGSHDGAPLAYRDDNRIIVAQYVAHKDGHPNTMVVVVPVSSENLSLLAGWQAAPIDGRLLRGIIENGGKPC